MAAAYAASFHVENVFLLERNEKLGKKIYITGKGRGNLTNAADISDFFDKIVSNPKFLYSSLYGFTNEQLLMLLSKYGLKTKTERGNRVFPVSDHASDITAAWTRALRDRKVEIRTDCGVKELIVRKERERLCVNGVRLDNGDTLLADHVIVATGGLSYPATGSTGDGLNFAKALGISTTPTHPALVPFAVKETDIFELSGLALKNVTFTVFSDDKRQSGQNKEHAPLASAKGQRLYEEFGEMLFTHFGISGPIVLSASSRIAKVLSESKYLPAQIDFKPRLSTEQLDKRLISVIDTQAKQSCRRLFDGLLPKSMGPLMLSRLSIASDRKIGTLTKEERTAVGKLLKQFPLSITGTRGFKEAIITQGGVSVKQIDPTTMRAKNVDGISFGGEVLDVDALTGGYNMQIAFSTGIAAGNGLMEEGSLGNKGDK